MTPLRIRSIKKGDALVISHAFQNQGWNKPENQYIRYWEEQKTGSRLILLAEYEDEFAGYLTILWQSGYLPFFRKKIPEVVDLNVLKKFQRRGIGTALMDEAEKRITERSKIAGIGFGLTQDYGPAQILYIKRGYIPDGNGIVVNNRSLEYGDTVIIGDDPVLYLTKQL